MWTSLAGLRRLHFHDTYSRFVRLAVDEELGLVLASGPIQTFATHFGGGLLRMFESKDHEPNISF